MARFEVPDGWTVQAYRFALDPSPAQVRALRSHAGAARKAHNTMLALVKAVMDQRRAERSYGIAGADLTPELNWSLAGLRKEWNRRKDRLAPWWAENSKEAYNTGLDALARGLDAWSRSRKGERAGKAVGFPRFKPTRSRRSVRFTTGPIRVEADRHHVNASGMRSAGGAHKRGLNRALADASLAEVRRMLRYKCTWYGSTLVEAGRYYPSSKLCSACGRRKPNLNLADRTYMCGHCGVRIDRDLNAAVNLARLGEARQLMLAGEQGPAGSGPVAGRGATREAEPARAGDAGGRETSTPHRQPPGKTGTASPQGEAA